MNLASFQTENIKKNEMGEIIARQKPFWVAGMPRAYHPFTKDWILNEVFRRLDDEGRTMHEYLEQVVKPTIGAADVFVASSDADLERTLDYKSKQISFDPESSIFSQAESDAMIEETVKYQAVMQAALPAVLPMEIEYDGDPADFWFQAFN